MVYVEVGPYYRTTLVGMEVGVKLLLDELGQARSGPQVRGESVLGGRVGQPAEHDLLLSASEPGRTPECASGADRQALVAVAAEGGRPAPDAPGRDLKEGSDLLSRVPLGEALNGEMASPLQFFGCTYRSHTRGHRKPRADLTLLT